MKTISIAAIAMWVACAFPALAADGLPGATVRADAARPQGERKARLEAWCKANPEKCREMQARREARRAQCKADPEKCRAEMQARGQERFKKADANGDGSLTREEARNGMRMVARHFDQIDANKDGVVTLEELQAARKARAESRKGQKI
ncbi:MAG: hypothetical protein A3I02_01745 [Betaproteobacteria bacterium RIFCSPLOWO2_02_FULL_67_26]|nr:MAG: hypothetical protein A3I02_01745 [Betaproteobacteria bacterium RIFCSPLOWO2_02_FULL_67_26]